jgi:hypothetical protein
MKRKDLIRKITSGGCVLARRWSGMVDGMIFTKLLKQAKNNLSPGMRR